VNINKEFACVKHKVVMPCNCYGRDLMALEEAAYALAKAAKNSHTCLTYEDGEPTDECKQFHNALAAYEKVRGK
jgi:hypothetical protein